jgi:hypothetical protein
MPIHFIANDPLSVKDLPLRVIKPRPARPVDRAGFNFYGAVAEKPYGLGTPGFLFWQCREAALAALETWEHLAGPLERWQMSSKLDLHQDRGVDFNAYYNRRSLSFFHGGPPEDRFFSGASTDVVAHEAGHAFLDAIRPDLWNSSLFEINAFHEAFGDCMAILTALADLETRQALLPVIGSNNFVETTSEDLAAAVRKQWPNDNSARPRRAINSFQWSPPDTLPVNGGPDDLIAECHSFAQIFTGCFYQVLLSLFVIDPVPTEQGLWAATQQAGRLLIEATRKVSQKPRFFREVGRYMVLADMEAGGKNCRLIESAFHFHGVALGLDLTLTPSGSVPGDAPVLSSDGEEHLDDSTRRSILSRFGTSSGDLQLERQEVAGHSVVLASHTKMVHLGDLDRRLQNVVAAAPMTTMVGSERGRAVLLGSQPNPADVVEEVRCYVRSLLASNAIDFERQVWTMDQGMVKEESGDGFAPTHVVEDVGGTRVLRRKCFCCGDRRRRQK